MPRAHFLEPNTPVPSPRDLLARYGPIAVGVYLAIFALTMTGFYVAIRAGYTPSTAAGTTGTVGAAWLATKLTQPLRIAATVVLTPLAAALMRRRAP